MSIRGMFKKLVMIIIVAFMLVTNFHINVRAEDELEPTEEPAVTETTETETAEEVLPEEVVVEEETLPVEETEEVVVEEETLPVEETEEVVSTPTEEVKEEKVVEESFAESKTIDGITISVKAEPGVFPNGSTLSVRKVTASEEQKVQEAVDEQRDYSCNVAATYTFDIKVLDSEGNEVQPTEGKKVEVTFQLEEVLNTNLETSVYHIDDEETATALDIQENEDTVSVETDGFSYYTVEFTYDHLEYSIEGGSKVALSTILENIGLTGTITNAVSSNPDLFTVDNSSGEWVLTSLQAFDTHETLTVTINGIEYVIEVTDSQHSHSGTVHGISGWQAWNDSANLPTASGNYYLNTDVTRSRPQIPKSGTATIKLCLNGHKITLTGGNNGLYNTGSSTNVNLTIYDSDDNSGIITNTSTYGAVIRVKAGSTYTLAGGKITNCNCSSYNAPVYLEDGTFTMKGGMICNNTLTDFAPVYVTAGTFNMSGGTITGNTNKSASGFVASGVHVIGGTFNMSGGSITNNNSPDANYAAGVYFQSPGLFNVKGKVTITGNTSKGKDLNVRVNSNRTIGINGNLDSDSRIGVTTATAPSGSTTIQFTNGLSGKGSKTNFISDNPDYTVMIKNNEAHLIAHKHEFEYSADKDTITATCVNMVTDCPLEDRKATLKIVAPALKVYGGSESEKATLEGEIPGVTPPTIVYKKDGQTLSAAPKNAGEYTAEITLTGSDNIDATASVDYTIEKADITPVVNIDNWNYGETPKTPSVTSASNPGGGAVSFKYYTDAECTTETGTAQGATESGGVPSKGGNYWVKAAVAETDNYKSGTGTKGFEITATSITATGITFDLRVYDGTTNADLDVSNAELVGVALGDDVRIKSATGEFEDKNVGTGKTIKNIVIELEGDDAGGYSATSDPATITGAITPKTVTVTEGITAQDKDYDGKTDATVDTSGATIDGMIDEDDLQAVASGQFDNANVGDDKTVNLTVTGLDGEDKGNYELASSGHQATTTASILPLTMQLEVTGYEGEYDEQDHHITVNVIEPTSDYHITFKGPNDTEFTHVNPPFQDPGEYVVQYRVTHAHYKVETGSATVKIIGKDFEGITSSPYKDEYDRYPHTIGLTLPLDCEGCKVTYADSESGPYSDDPIAYTDFTNGPKTVYFKVSKTGYNDFISSNTVTITKKPVKVQGIGAEDKTYDGTVKADLVFGDVVIDGKIDGDDLDVKATGRFVDKNAGDEKTVAIEDLALTGSASKNYELASSGQQATTTATINKQLITVSDITSPGKIYDGSTDAPLYLKDAHLDGKIPGDDLSVTATGAFEDKHVGSNKTINISGLALSGNDAGNYELAPTGQQETTTGNIAQYEVVVTADDKEKFYGESDPEFTYESIPSKLIGDDVLEGELSRQEGENVGTYKITLGTLHDHEGNYAISSFTEGTLTIKKATSNSVTASIEGWTYGDDPKAPSATATHGADTATFTYSDAEDGTYTSEVPTNKGTYYVKAHIADTDNYPEATSDPVKFKIAQKEIEIEWGETEFTYDGKAHKPEATAKGLVGTDVCTVEVSGEKIDSNQKTGTENYEATATSLSNDNYTLPENKNTTFTISPKELNYDMLELEGGDVLKADGSEKGPTIGLDDEGILEDNVPYELKEGEDYTVSGDATATNPGTYSFTIEGTGNYTGTLTSSWVLTNNMQNYDEEPAVDGVGKLAVFVDVIGNTENIKVDNFTLDLAKGLLTDEEIEKRSEGENVLVYMEIFEIPKSEVDETDRKLIMKEFKKEGATDFRWFNVMVYKKIGNEQAQEVHDTYKEVKITIAIPKDYKDAPNGYSRTYYLGRAHDGKGSIINTTDNKQIYTSTHEFSIYALAYKDTKRNTPKYVDPNLLSVPNTADPTDLGLWIGMLLLSIASFFALKRVKKSY